MLIIVGFASGQKMTTIVVLAIIVVLGHYRGPAMILKRKIHVKQRKIIEKETRPLRKKLWITAH